MMQHGEAEHAQGGIEEKACKTNDWPAQGDVHFAVVWLNSVVAVGKPEGIGGPWRAWRDFDRSACIKLFVLYTKLTF